MPNGFFGELLAVDLTTGALARQPVPPKWYRQFLGGSGLAARLLLPELSPGLDPLAPEAPLALVAGLLTGLPVATACKLSVCGLSPLTGIWNEATGGGHFPAALRGCGVDGLVLRGQARSPVYLLLDESGGRLLPADDLWGQDTFVTAELLEERHGRGARVACIGPAGEHGVRFAALMLDGRIARAVGRGGTGAVFGAKRLKAIVAVGKRQPEVHDRETLRRLLVEAAAPLRANAPGLHQYGTPGAVEAVEFWGDLPIKNWQLGSWKEGASKTCGQAYLPRTLDRHHACANCPLRCSKLIRLDVGPHAPLAGHGPEYETVAGFGANCLNDDPDVILAANEACNRLGLDTISAAAMVAFALEARERGVLGPEEAGGLSLRWGDPATILGLLPQIAHRQGVGDLLAEGSRRAAARLGGPATELAIETKGLEYAFHDPRAFPSMAVHYATANRGACHLDGLTYFIGRGVTAPELGFAEPLEPSDPADQARLARTMQDFLGLFNPLGLCKFLFLGKVGPTLVARWLAAATGWQVAPDELARLGERQFQLKRLINVRLGVSRQDDRLPRRLANHPRPDGKAAGVLPDLEAQLRAYYAQRGWSPEGVPLPETLSRLGLAELATTPIPGESPA